MYDKYSVYLHPKQRNMEKGEDTTIVLRKDRGYAGCIQQGLAIVTHKFNLLWKFLWPMLMLICATNAIMGVITYYNPFSAPLLYATILANALMYVYYLAMISVMVRKLDELGYVPSVKAWVLGRTTISRSLRSGVIVVISLLVGIICLYGYTMLTPESGPIPQYYAYIKLALLVLLLLMSVPFGMFSMDFLFGNKSLIATLRNTTANMKYAGNYLAVIVVSGTLMAIFTAVGAFPLFLTTHVTEVAIIGRMQGDVAELPNYFPVLCALAQGLCAIITSLSVLLLAFPAAFLWGKLNEENDN